MSEAAPRFLNYHRARFSVQLPLSYRYTQEHFWIAELEPAISRVGLTKFGSRQLGEVVDFGFELSPGAPIKAGQAVGWVEGFKAVWELASPADGAFLGGNPALEKQPTLVNQDPHSSGWLFSVRGSPAAHTLDASGYAEVLDHAIDTFLRRQDSV